MYAATSLPSARPAPRGRGPLEALRETLGAWRRRAAGRRALAQMTDRQLVDIGLDPFDAIVEAGKPFWRA